MTPLHLTDFASPQRAMQPTRVWRTAKCSRCVTPLNIAVVRFPTAVDLTAVRTQIFELLRTSVPEVRSGLTSHSTVFGTERS
jgi:hypothetical protein